MLNNIKPDDILPHNGEDIEGEMKENVEKTETKPKNDGFGNFNRRNRVWARRPLHHLTDKKKRRVDLKTLLSGICISISLFLKSFLSIFLSKKQKKGMIC